MTIPMSTQGQVISPQSGSTVIMNFRDRTSEEAAATKKGKSAGHEVGKWLYMGAEALVHSELLARGNAVYQSTYIAGFVAGVTFGLYQSFTNKTSTNLQDRATTFAKKNNDHKAFMLAEVAIRGPVALRILESYQPGGLSLGNLVPLYWSFNSGSELTQYVYKAIKSHVSEESI